jgi:ribose-phosphate pyrophosphokinase
MAENSSSYVLFSGSSHEELASKIASELNVSLGKVLRETFPDGEIGIQIQENVRGKDVFLLQSLALRPNHYLMELLIMADALKRSSARSISAIVPYFAYSRQDRKDKPHVPITAKLVANLLEKAGITRILTMDLHTEQMQGFFDISVDHLYARPLFIKAFKKLEIKDLIVVSPDLGCNKLAREFAADLDVDLAIVDKRRLDACHVKENAFIGDVKGKNVVLVDDMCSTGETLKMAAQACRKRGAKAVYAVVTHGLFVNEGGLKDSGIDQIYVTDTIPANDRSGIEVKIVESAELFARAIDCVVNAKSITSLFY